MNVVSRGIKNAFRNSIRTFSIVVILGISVGLALSMLVARQAVEDKIATVKSSVGNTISISPAGARGFEGGGEPLTTAQMTKVSQTTHVTKVAETLSDRLTTENTNLQSSVTLGSLGNRFQNNSGVGFQAPPDDASSRRSSDGSNSGSSSSGQVTRTFTPPVTITGINDTTVASVYGGDTVTFTSGAAFDASKDENKAVVGKAMAEKNSLKVGSTFTAYGQTITVTGIYDTGNSFANNGVFVSLTALQRLSSQTGAVTSATVTVDSIDNVDNVASALKTTLGSNADVVSNQESAKTAVEPLESVKTIASYSVIGALVAGATIILLTMMMIVRERRREIGVMKAIGSSNAKTMMQFMSEAVTLTMIGLVVGLLFSILTAQPITNVLVNNSSSSSSSTQQTGQRPGGFGGRLEAGSLGQTLRTAKDVKTSVGTDLLLYGVGAAFLIALLGSALPAYFISKIRPAEVMRAD